jgi:hypothetical protein
MKSAARFESPSRFPLSILHLFQNIVLLSLPPQLQSEIDVTSGNGGIYGTNANFLRNGSIPAGGAVDSALFTNP